MDSPSEQFAGMNLNQDVDDGLPQYESSGDEAVSMVGSSVSQTQQTTCQVDAAMVADAVKMITDLSQEVLTYYLLSVSTLTIFFTGCFLEEADCCCFIWFNSNGCCSCCSSEEY